MKKFIRKVFPEQKNPFKSLLLTAALCAVLRVVIGLFITLASGELFAWIFPITISAQLTDLIFLRPQLKKVFRTVNFSQEHISWLKERQDISPDKLRVFFRKLLSFRASALGVALTAFFFIWIVKDINIALLIFLVVYVGTLMVRFSLFHSEQLELFPKRYRPNAFNFPYRVRIET